MITEIGGFVVATLKVTYYFLKLLKWNKIESLFFKIGLIFFL